MAQAPGTQDIERQIIKAKEEILSMSQEITTRQRVGDDFDLDALRIDLRRKCEYMSALANEQRRETLNWIQGKLDDLEST